MGSDIDFIEDQRMQKLLRINKKKELTKEIYQINMNIARAIERVELAEGSENKKPKTQAMAK